jgi:hypothetical protein
LVSSSSSSSRPASSVVAESNESLKS